MLDEIINYIQSLQRQVEVDDSLPLSVSPSLPLSPKSLCVVCVHGWEGGGLSDLFVVYVY